MKTVNVSELKTHLSRYLRLVKDGERILVMDRKRPAAHLVPVDPGELGWRERLAQQGWLRLGTQDWGQLPVRKRRPSRAKIQESLQAVREDPSEVHRR